MADSGKPQYLVEYQLTYLAGDPNEFLVDDVQIRDALNEPYNIRVRCRIPAARTESAYQACSQRRLKDVQLVMRRRFPDGFVLETKIVGVILSVERNSLADDDDPFVVTMVPAFALLAHQAEGGTWHNRTYPDVLRKVLREGLAPYGRTIEDKITRAYPEMDLIVRRPDESLLDFVKKICGRTGINFYFKYDGSVETLVLCDSNDGFLDGNQRQRRDLPFKPVWFEHATDGEEQVLHAVRNSSLGTSESQFKGFDVSGTPPERVSSSAKADGGHDAKVQINDSFRVNEREDPDTQHARVAQLHGEVAANKTASISLRTSITGALAGRRFKFEVELGDVREYIVQSVEASGRSYDRPGNDYSNSITAVSTTADGGGSVNVRALSPRNEGEFPAVMRAEVVAVENDPVDVDGFMRCRLRFAWDNQTGEVPTTYVSVLQPMAGTHGGTQWIPRAGDRVLVSFIGGNHERPVILGCLYDKQHQPPTMGPPESATTLPTSASWLGFNFASIGDKSRQSMLCMDVTAGAEMMFFNAPFDWRQDVGNDCDVRIKRDELRQIKRNFDEKVDGNYDHLVKGNRTEVVKGNYSLDVDGSATIDIAGGSKGTFTGPVSHTCKAGVHEYIDRGHVENVTSGHRTTRVASGSCTYSVGGGFAVVASSISIGVGMGGGAGGGSGPATGGALSLGQTATLDCAGGAMVQSGPSSVRTNAEGVTLRGPSAHLHDQAGGVATLANGSYVVDVPQGIVFRCGATELRLSPQGLFVNGQQLVMQAGRTEIRTASFDIEHPEPGGEDD